MFPSVSDVIAALNDLKDRGTIAEYAIGGAFALSVWDEISTTFDLDVLVSMPATNNELIGLGPFYEWAGERGHEVVAEHIKISGVPVQFLPATNALAEEAIKNAKTVEVGGSPLRVVGPEYLRRALASTAGEYPASKGARCANARIGTDK